MLVSEVETPSLVVDLDTLERNIQSMAEHARLNGVGLRPHAKTHKSAEIAAMQLRAGALGLTLAKIGEVEALLDAQSTNGSGPLPLSDVMVAFPIVGASKLTRLLALAERVRVTVALDSPDAASQLGEAAASQGRTIGVVVEVDTGGRRCGVLPGDPTLALARQVAATTG